MKILAKKFGIERSEIMAIGDSYNDLPMLKAAGISVAMGNSTEEVKNSCDLVTELCENDGFAYAVANFIFGDEDE